MTWLLIAYLFGVFIVGGYYIIVDSKATFAEAVFVSVFYPIVLLVWGTFIILIIAVTLLVTLIGAVDIILKGIGNHE